MHFSFELIIYHKSSLLAVTSANERFDT